MVALLLYYYCNTLLVKEHLKTTIRASYGALNGVLECAGGLET